MYNESNMACYFVEEAENERMHLLTALDLKDPSLLFRFCVIASQGLLCFNCIQYSVCMCLCVCVCVYVRPHVCV